MYLNCQLLTFTLSDAFSLPTEDSQMMTLLCGQRLLHLCLQFALLLLSLFCLEGRVHYGGGEMQQGACFKVFGSFGSYVRPPLHTDS